MSVLPRGTKDGWGAYLLPVDEARDRCGMGVVDDEFLARRAIWVAGFVEEPGIYGDCGVDAGSGDWGEYGVVFGRQWSAAESSAISESRAARGGVFEDAFF